MQQLDETDYGYQKDNPQQAFAVKTGESENLFCKTIQGTTVNLCLDLSKITTLHSTNVTPRAKEVVDIILTFAKLSNNNKFHITKRLSLLRRKKSLEFEEWKKLQQTDSNIKIVSYTDSCLLLVLNVDENSENNFCNS